MTKPTTTFEEPSFDLSNLATEAGENLITEALEEIIIDAPAKPLTTYEEV